MTLNRCFKFGNLILAAAFSAGLGFGLNASAQQTEHSYLIDLNSKTVTDLGDVDARAINDIGQVAGGSRALSGAYHAFITGPNGKGIRDLGTLGGTNSAASGINNFGQVVGPSDTSAGLRHAFMTDVDGTNMRDLTASKFYGEAGDINDAGQVAGWFAEQEAAGPMGLPHAFITGPNGAGMKDIVDADAVPGWYFVNPSGINAAGQVAGSAGDPPNRPFITGENGVGIREIGYPGSYYAAATGINDAGQVIVSYLTFSEDGESWRAFITGADGAGMTDLGSLGGNYSSAHGINNAGQVVGSSTTAEAASHAFITGANGAGITDLNSLVDLPDGVVLRDAMGINNSGQVIATGVPEPETYALMLVGLGLVGLMARRKRLLA